MIIHIKRDINDGGIFYVSASIIYIYIARLKNFYVTIKDSLIAVSFL